MKHSWCTFLLRLKCIKITWYLWIFFIHITLVIRRVNGVKPPSISRQKKLIFTLIYSETMMIFAFILKLKDISIVRHRFTSQMPWIYIKNWVPKLSMSVLPQVGRCYPIPMTVLPRIWGKSVRFNAYLMMQFS